MIFPTTHWSALARATLHGESQAREALEDLCGRYWKPVFQFICSRGYSTAEAEDLTQEFMLHIIQKSLFTRADRFQGRFRSFLLGSLVRFLNDATDRRKALKRGGTAAHVSFEASESTEEPEQPASPEATLFDREWAMTILETALRRMRTEYAAAGRPGDFEHLKDYLPGGTGGPSYLEAAGRMGLTLPAFKSEVHRLRIRLRELIRTEVSCTVSAPHEIEEEITHLGRILMDRGSEFLPGK